MEVKKKSHKDIHKESPIQKDTHKESPIRRGACGLDGELACPRGAWIYPRRSQPLHTPFKQLDGKCRGLLWLEMHRSLTRRK